MSRFTPWLLIALTVTFAIGFKVGLSPAERLQTFASAFLETLDEGQREQAMEDFDSPQRVDWHFVPMAHRKGVMFGDMDDAQQTAALRLLRAALSEAGYNKANRIMLLEEVLNEMEGDQGRWKRDPQRYFVTVFGNPASGQGDERWGLSFEGHHLSLNFVCQGNEVLDSTPQFLGANPATVMNETAVTLGEGTAVLSREEQLGFKLVNSLSEQQQAVAVIAEEAPAEIRFAGKAQATPVVADGIAYTELNQEQQSNLRDLVATYLDVQADPIAEARRERIEADRWNSVHFAWAGARKPGIGHYYRVTGKRFLIEFCNTQSDPAGNPANHIHCVYRDLTGDFDLPITP